jgi:hypothetical protein
LILTDDEIRSLTRREQPAAQARVLDRLGIAFRRHPIDGVLLVPRDSTVKALGGEIVLDAPRQYEIRREAFERRRKPAGRSSADETFVTGWCRGWTLH